MSAQQHTNDAHGSDHAEHEGMTKSKIWQVFFYMLGLTALEFFIALYMLPKGLMGHGVGNFIYIVLTLVKAYYIVAYFMHLKYEKFALKTGITVSLVFIVYFIILMLTEGSYQFLHMN